ncbi:hypothetical protein FQN54_001507 [Arachnomyces sp. PD_36]|nr:hypothetical protein FQN54_001507 [Arachnomyces sp. PD_36]
MSLIVNHVWQIDTRAETGCAHDHAKLARTQQFHPNRACALIDIGVDDGTAESSAQVIRVFLGPSKDEDRAGSRVVSHVPSSTSRDGVVPVTLLDGAVALDVSLQVAQAGDLSQQNRERRGIVLVLDHVYQRLDVLWNRGATYNPGFVKIQTEVAEQRTLLGWDF